MPILQNQKFIHHKKEKKLAKRKIQFKIRTSRIILKLSGIMLLVLPKCAISYEPRVYSIAEITGIVVPRCHSIDTQTSHTF